MNFEKCGWRVKSVMEGDGGKRKFRVLKMSRHTTDFLQLVARSLKLEWAFKAMTWVLVKGGWAQPDKKSHMRISRTF